MSSLTTAADRFRAARGLPAVLDAACDAFEQILTAVAACEQATSTGVTLALLFAGTQAANGRDAMLFAPSLPPQSLHAPAPVGERRQPDVPDLRATIAGLAELLASGLGHTATTAAGGDAAACYDAAACATRIHGLLTRPPS
jgi:hypothetical protein